MWERRRERGFTVTGGGSQARVTAGEESYGGLEEGECQWKKGWQENMEGDVSVRGSKVWFSEVELWSTEHEKYLPIWVWDLWGQALS